MSSNDTSGESMSKRAFLGKVAATAGVAAGVGALADPVAAGCQIRTLTTDETSNEQCFTREEATFYRNAEVNLTIDGDPNTEWELRVNNQSTDSGLCSSPFDKTTTVTTDSATISIFDPEAFYGIEVDKNGDDLTYDLELWLCA